MISSNPSRDKKNPQDGPGIKNSTGKKSVLVADNSRVIRAIIREELEAIGLHVIEAENEEGIFSILATVPIHLMTISVELSGHNGYEICRTINNESFYHSPANASDQRFPIIFITSHDTLEGRRHGFDNGAADFISKPFPRGRWHPR